MDVKHGCMPNGFGHILFGKLKGLYDNESDPYYGDRIYIKPEEFGLQKFKHYIGRMWFFFPVRLITRFHLDSGKYLQSISRRIICKIAKFQTSPMCAKDNAFRENTDVKLTKKWNQILSSIPIITDEERTAMRDKASKEGIHEIYRQTARFLDEYIQVRDFRKELETKYGRDARSRKGNEIIFTTEQLLQSRISCDAIISSRQSAHHAQCPMANSSTIASVLN